MSDDRHPSGGRSSVVALLAALLALMGLLTTNWGEVDRGTFGSAIGRDLVRIADLASLRSGAADSPAAGMPVAVIPEGGPAWVGPEGEAAVQADPIFTLGEPHLLRIDQVEQSRVFGVRTQLWRQGWSLRAPEPLWVTPAPWIVLLSIVAGAAWAGLRRGLAGGAMVSGVLGQLLILALPWPDGFARPSLQQTWRDGPLGHHAYETAMALPDSSVAVGAGVITLCAVLMIFDHRRSPDQGGGLVLFGILGVMGGLAWLEAALRAGLWPWLQQPAGVVAMLGAAGLWWWAWSRRERKA